MQSSFWGSPRRGNDEGRWAIPADFHYNRLVSFIVKKWYELWKWTIILNWNHRFILFMISNRMQCRLLVKFGVKECFPASPRPLFFSGVLAIGLHLKSSCMWKFKRGRKPGYFRLSTVKHKIEMADNNSRRTNDQKSVNQNRNLIKLRLLTS